MYSTAQFKLVIYGCVMVESLERFVENFATSRE